MDFTAIRRAGLTHAEFAKIVGVTRSTVTLWATGRFRPNRYIKDNVAAELQRLEARAADRRAQEA